MNKLPLTEKHYPFLRKFLEASDHVFIILLDATFIIKGYNKAFKSFINVNEDLNGRPITDFLTSDSALALKQFDERESYKSKLNLGIRKSAPMIMECDVCKVNGDYFIISNRLTMSDDKVLKQMTVITNELANMSRELQRKNAALEKARTQIKTLKGIVPICMYCKEIRDDKGYWNKLEQFIQKHSEAEFSHGICPDCMDKYYPDEEE